jgi:hypothetical protein
MTTLRWVVAGLLLAGLVALIEHLTDTVLGEWFRFGGTLSLGDAELETPRTAAVLPILDSPLTQRSPWTAPTGTRSVTPSRTPPTS